MSAPMVGTLLIGATDSSPNLPPTGEQIERFFTSMPSKVRTHSPAGVPSFSWIKHGVVALIQGLIFKHESFRLSPHQSLRISTAIDKLLKDGAITAEPSRIKQWVTAALVLRLANFWLINALTQGTKSWDITISRLLSMVLMAGCASRAGEIARSPKYIKMECLCWKDVDMRFDRASEHFVVRITLRFQKKER
jgi:hypothetical protein